MRDPKERLLDILEAIDAIERHPGRDKAAFERDELLQVWFLRHLQIAERGTRQLREESGDHRQHARREERRQPGDGGQGERRLNHLCAIRGHSSRGGFSSQGSLAV